MDEEGGQGSAQFVGHPAEEPPHGGPCGGIGGRVGDEEEEGFPLRGPAQRLPVREGEGTGAPNPFPLDGLLVFLKQRAPGGGWQRTRRAVQPADPSGGKVGVGVAALPAAGTGTPAGRGPSKDASGPGTDGRSAGPARRPPAARGAGAPGPAVAPMSTSGLPSPAIVRSGRSEIPGPRYVPGGLVPPPRPRPLAEGRDRCPGRRG